MKDPTNFGTTVNRTEFRMSLFSIVSCMVTGNYTYVNSLSTYIYSYWTDVSWFSKNIQVHTCLYVCVHTQKTVT